MIRAMIRTLRGMSAPLHSATGGLDRTLLGLFLLINGIVLANAVLHPPSVGYDSAAHLRYIKALSQLRFPTRADTYEFFSPPLSYLPPALLLASGLLGEGGAGKAAQLLNVACSLGLTLVLLHVCELIRPGAPTFKATALLLLGMIPVYYKTFAFVRPEPLLAFLWVLAVCRTLRVFVKGEAGARGVVALGCALGLLVLARQQGFFWILALLLFVGSAPLTRKSLLRPWLRATVASLAIAFLVGGWFYLRLYVKYGSPTAYAKERRAFSLDNQPPDFYLGLGEGKLFEDPVRPAFRNQLLPKLYSETWGDHECYFLVSGFDRRRREPVSGAALEDALSRERARVWLRTNREEMGHYLGRVNLVALFPSAVLLAGFAAGCAAAVRFLAGSSDEHATLLAPLALGVLVTMAGYLFLLVQDASRSGNMIKATYIVHVFPMLALLGADLLEGVRRRAPSGYRVLLAALVLAAAHNSPAFFTSYTPSGAPRPKNEAPDDRARAFESSSPRALQSSVPGPPPRGNRSSAKGSGR